MLILLLTRGRLVSGTSKMRGAWAIERGTALERLLLILIQLWIEGIIVGCCGRGATLEWRRVRFLRTLRGRSLLLLLRTSSINKAQVVPDSFLVKLMHCNLLIKGNRLVESLIAINAKTTLLSVVWLLLAL